MKYYTKRLELLFIAFFIICWVQFAADRFPLIFGKESLVYIAELFKRSMYIDFEDGPIYLYWYKLLTLITDYSARDLNYLNSKILCGAVSFFSYILLRRLNVSVFFSLTALISTLFFTLNSMYSIGDTRVIFLTSLILLYIILITSPYLINRVGLGISTFAVILAAYIRPEFLSLAVILPIVNLFYCKYSLVGKATYLVGYILFAVCVFVLFSSSPIKFDRVNLVLHEVEELIIKNKNIKMQNNNQTPKRYFSNQRENFKVAIVRFDIYVKQMMFNIINTFYTVREGIFIIISGVRLQLFLVVLYVIYLILRGGKLKLRWVLFDKRSKTITLSLLLMIIPMSITVIMLYPSFKNLYGHFLLINIIFFVILDRMFYFKKNSYIYLSKIFLTVLLVISAFSLKPALRFEPKDIYYKILDNINKVQLSPNCVKKKKRVLYAKKTKYQFYIENLNLNYTAEINDDLIDMGSSNIKFMTAINRHEYNIVIIDNMFKDVIRESKDDIFKATAMDFIENYSSKGFSRTTIRNVEKLENLSKNNFNDKSVEIYYRNKCYNIDYYHI